MRAVLAVAFNQITRLMVDRGALTLLLLLPLSLNFILGVSLKNTFQPDFRPERLPRVAVSAGDGPMAAVLAAALTSDATAGLLEVETVAGPREARTALLERRADAAVIVPADLPASPVRILAEPGTVAGGVVEEAVRSILAALSDPQAAGIPVEIARAAVGGERPDGDAPRAMDYYAVGMGVMTLFFAAARGTESLLQDRKTGVYLRVRAGGVSRVRFLLGKFLGSVIIGLLFMAAMAVLTRLLFGVRWGDPLGWALLTLGSVLAATGFNLLMMAFIRRPEVLDALSTALFQVLGFFGGSMMPIYIFPDVLQRISGLLPNRWMLDGYLALLAGAGPADVLDETARLVVAALLLVAVGWLLENASARAAGEA